MAEGLAELSTSADDQQDVGALELRGHAKAGVVGGTRLVPLNVQFTTSDSAMREGDDVLLYGYLEKKGGIGRNDERARAGMFGRRNWKRRWFVLRTFSLQYYATAADTEPLGEIPLEGARLSVLNLRLVLSTQSRDYNLRLPNQTDHRTWARWHEALISALESAADRGHATPTARDAAAALSPDGSPAAEVGTATVVRFEQPGPLGLELAEVPDRRTGEPTLLLTAVQTGSAAEDALAAAARQVLNDGALSNVSGCLALGPGWALVAVNGNVVDGWGYARVEPMLAARPLTLGFNPPRLAAAEAWRVPLVALSALGALGSGGDFGKIQSLSERQPSGDSPTPQSEQRVLPVRPMPERASEFELQLRGSESLAEVLHADRAASHADHAASHTDCTGASVGEGLWTLSLAINTPYSAILETDDGDPVPAVALLLKQRLLLETRDLGADAWAAVFSDRASEETVAQWVRRFREPSCDLTSCRAQLEETEPQLCAALFERFYKDLCSGAGVLGALSAEEMAAAGSGENEAQACLEHLGEATQQLIICAVDLVAMLLPTTEAGPVAKCSLIAELAGWLRPEAANEAEPFVGQLLEFWRATLYG
jgi:hypothetical protein